jgi:hypothetical protein
MSDLLSTDTWQRLSAARHTPLALRGIVVVAPLVAVVCTWAAAHHVVGVIGFVVGGLGFVCALAPDSHAGMAVLAVVAIEWVSLVDDVTTPWALPTAAALTAFHAACAAATVTASATRWTQAMIRRWVRRTLLVLIAPLGTWIAVAAVHGHRTRAAGTVVVGAMVTVTAGAAWVLTRTRRPATSVAARAPRGRRGLPR